MTDTEPQPERDEGLREVAAALHAHDRHEAPDLWACAVCLNRARAVLALPLLTAERDRERYAAELADPTSLRNVLATVLGCDPRGRESVDRVTDLLAERDEARERADRLARAVEALRDLALYDEDGDDAALARWHNKRVRAALSAAEPGSTDD